jgi:glucuronoarabinoxylan endo-1,4-beta-xylanase
VNFLARSLLSLTCGCVSLSLLGCGDTAKSRPAPPEEEAEDVSVSLAETHQHISGFGASTAWTAPNLSDELSDQLFSVDAGIGLSLVRLRIQPSGDSGEVETAEKAVARGARVWASPWTPPGMWKTNNADTNGGSLLPEHYQDWADRLAAFAKTMSDRGLPLAMLSAQNEPNWTAEWETCRWTEGELVTFIRDYLGPALVAHGVETPILAPETIGWSSIAAYADALLGDPAARKFVGAVATHGYGGAAFAYSAPAAHDKEFWVTELDDGSDGADRTMSSGLRVAGLIHEHLTVASVSAWHYWWISPRLDLPITTNGALLDDQGLTRRAYVLGNWSKFVRPGFVRVGATAQPQRGLRVTAFRDATASRVVIVAVNHHFEDKEQSFELDSPAFERFSRFVTSDADALLEVEPVSATDGSFSVTLPPLSVTTFVADAADGASADGVGGTSGGGAGQGTSGAGGIGAGGIGAGGGAPEAGNAGEASDG